LLLAFPLGIAYFTFLVTGFSLGVGLLIVWVGFIILAGVLAFCWPLTLFERQLAIGLLHVDVPPMETPNTPGSTLFEGIKAHLTNPATWEGIAFLFLKFPFGIASFVATVTLLFVSLGLLFAPLAYPWVRINLGFMEIRSMPAALIAMVLGLVAAPLSLHLLNLLAIWQGQLARTLLGNPVTLQPQDPPVFQSPSPSPAQPGL